MVAVGGCDGGHDLHGLFDSSSHKVPPWGLGDEGKDEEDEDEGGQGGGEVEVPPCWEEVGNAGEERDAGGEEVEGGHAGGAAHCGPHGLGGEDEGAEANAAGAEAGEDAEDDVGPVVWGE